MSTVPVTPSVRVQGGTLLSVPSMTGTQLLRGLWLGVGLTLPLFGVDYLRVHVNVLGYIALPMVLLAIIVAVGTVMWLMRDPGLPRPLVAPEYRPLLIMVYLFLAWHVFSLQWSIDYANARREAIKLAVAALSFWGTLAFFPRDRKLFEGMAGLALWASALLVAYLMYVYAFVFGALYLGTNVETPARWGRNQLAWYLAVCFPYAVLFLRRTRVKLLAMVPVMTLLVAILYLSSRSAWLAVVVGLFYAAIATWRESRAEALRLLVWLLAGGAAVVVVALWLITLEVDLTEIGRRFVSIYSPEDVPELHSYEARWAAVRDSVEAFLRTPLVGVGLANAAYYAGRLTHNDYVTVLSELGLVGGAMFLGVLLLIAREIFRSRPRGPLARFARAAQASWMSMVVYFVFINVYASVHFWLLTALLLISCEISRAEGAGREGAP